MPASRNVRIAPVTSTNTNRLGNNQQGGHNTTRQESYTNVITLEMVDIEKTKDAGARLCVYDAASVRAATPARSHGLTTLAKGSTALMTLHDPPKGVIVANQGLLPPTSKMNPHQGSSWCYMATAYGTTPTTCKQAVQHICHLAADLLRQGFFEANINIPGKTAEGGWQTTSTVLQERVCLTRSGTMHTGGGYTFRELINFKLMVRENVPDKYVKVVKQIASQYQRIVIMDSSPLVSVSPSTSHETSANRNADTRVFKRPVMNTGHIKKPLSRLARKTPSKTTKTTKVMKAMKKK